MSLSSIVSRLAENYPDFSYQGPNSILSSLISQFSYEIDSVFGKLDGSNDLDLFAQTGTQLDDLAALLGLSRQTIVAQDSDAVIPDQMLVVVKNPQNSLLTVLQELYGSQSNFPATLTVTDGSNTFELLQSFDTAQNLDTHQLVLPAKFTTFSLFPTEQKTELSIVGNYVDLSDYVSIKAATTLTLYQYVEPDDQLRIRIQSALQDYIGPSHTWLQSYISSNYPNVRYVLVKNFARGLQTADVVVFPTLQAIYDENYNLITENTLAETIYNDLKDQLPLGVDIHLINAERVPLSVEITFSDVPEDSTSALQDDQKSQLINTIYNYTIGEATSITTAQMSSDFNKNLAFVDYPYTISSFTVYVDAQQVSQIDLQDTQYPVLSDITISW